MVDGENKSGGRGSGHDELWQWFNLSRASFLVMPRALMHEMPDEWQGKMAKLLDEYDATFNLMELPSCKVMAVGEGDRFTKWPEWVLNYRRPDIDEIERHRKAPCEDCGNLDHQCKCGEALLAQVTAEIEAERSSK